MPKTADKRAQARRTARVQRAHQVAPDQAVIRRVPAARRRAKPRGFMTTVNNYPWATSIFVILLVGLALVFAHAQRLGPWQPTKPKQSPAVVQATCNLKTHTCDKAPLMTINTAKTYTATITLDKPGNPQIVIQLDAKNAPVAVNNFVFLANQHYYDGLDFWRVEQPGKTSPLNGQPSDLDLIQGGAPQAGGTGNVGYTVKDDPIVGDYTAGSVAMAEKQGQANSGSTQFFISIGDNSSALASNKKFPIFGHVTSGLDTAKQVQPGDKMKTVTITVK